jgi:hypothetical protein
MQARHVSDAGKHAKGLPIRGRAIADAPWIGIHSGAALPASALCLWRWLVTDEDEARPAAGLSDEGKRRRTAEEARLAAALRANLARRKRQARVRSAGDEEPEQG